MSNPSRLLPFQPMSMTAAQLAAVSFLAADCDVSVSVAGGRSRLGACCVEVRDEPEPGFGRRRVRGAVGQHEQGPCSVPPGTRLARGGRGFLGISTSCAVSKRSPTASAHILGVSAA